MPQVHIPALFNLAALLGDLRFDAIHLVADVHAIGDGALVVVFGDEVFIEEADRLLAGRSSEPDEEGVEVFEDLPPEVVDGAVGIGDDKVEGLDGDGGIVGDILRAVVSPGDLVGGFLIGSNSEKCQSGVSWHQQSIFTNRQSCRENLMPSCEHSLCHIPVLG